MAKKTKKRKPTDSVTPRAGKGAGDAPEVRRSGWVEWVRSILIAVGLALLIRWPIAEPFKIPSGSMEPTLHGDPKMLKGDRIFVNKHSYGVRFPFNGFRFPFTSKTLWYTDKWLWKGRDPDRWDIVVFKSAEEGVSKDTLVKRVVGLPGERVHIAGGRVYIDGVALDLPEGMPEIEYTTPLNMPYGVRTEDQYSLVPEGHVLLLGDNSANSRDGRRFGWLPTHHILGEVSSIWWPPARWRDFTGYTHTFWWNAMLLTLGGLLVVRLFVGRSWFVFEEGVPLSLERGERLFVRFALGLSIPFTGMRVGPGRALRRGELVLYTPPKDLVEGDGAAGLLGVVAGLPGEQVTFEDGRLHINDEAVTEGSTLAEVSFAADGGRYGRSRSREYSEVPDGHYFILCDGPPGGPDSRTLGWVSRDAVKGVATSVWWPVRRARRLKTL